MGLELVEVPVPGARKPASQELKLAFDAPEPRAPAGGEDAVADVVGEAHAVVLVFDPSKVSTARAGGRTCRSPPVRSCGRWITSRRSWSVCKVCVEVSLRTALTAA